MSRVSNEGSDYPRKMVECKLHTFQIDRAYYFAERRVAANRARYSGTRKQRVGRTHSKVLGEVVDKEFHVEFLGILAEVVVRDYLEARRDVVGMLASSFLKDSADVSDDADLVACKSDGSEVSISVKGADRNYVINKRTADGEMCDIVIYVIFRGEDKVFLRTFIPAEIRNWEVRKAKTEYYFKEFKEDE